LSKFFKGLRAFASLAGIFKADSVPVHMPFSVFREECPEMAVFIDLA
jgi:hypothetical protein